MPQSAAIFVKKQVLHQKGHFLCKKQATGLISATMLCDNIEKVKCFILEQIRINEFCPLTIIVLTTRI